MPLVTAPGTLPASAAAAVVHSGAVYVPVSDIPPIQICLAWDAARSSALIEDFADAVARTRADARSARAI